MTYHKKRKQAEDLREKGYSYSLIKEKINVSKSTLSHWLRNVPYTPNKETIKRVGKSQAASQESKARQKRESIQRARKVAKKELGKMSRRDLFVIGIGLYIGEGSKTQDSVRIINSDVNIIKLAMYWFMELGVGIENFSLAIHLYPDNNIKACMKYWSKATGIPIGQFEKTQIDRRAGKRRGKRGKLPHGTAHLSVRSRGDDKLGVFLARKINGYMEESFDQLARD